MKLDQKMQGSNSASHLESFTVQGATFTSRCERLDSDSAILERFHEVGTPFRETDAFGNFWNLAIRFSNLPVGFTTRGQTHHCTEFDAVFIPPFSLVEWSLPVGRHHWKALFSRVPLPSGAPQEPIAFKWRKDSFPNSPLEALEEVLRTEELFPVGKIEFASAVALRTKKVIDQHFMEPMKIAEVARQLGFSPAVMTRAFQSCYGIPPIGYRNKLRVFEALVMMILDRSSVTNSGLDSGFQDFSSYYRQFSRLLGVPPSQYAKAAKHRRDRAPEIDG